MCVLIFSQQILSPIFLILRRIRRDIITKQMSLHEKYRGADKSLSRPGRTQATATEDFEFRISYLQSQLEEY